MSSLKEIIVKVYAKYVVKETLKWSNNPIQTQEKVMKMLVSKAKNTKFGKFQEKKFNSLTAVKGGAAVGGKTSTTKMRTDEARNDIDSNSGIEGAAAFEIG